LLKRRSGEIMDSVSPYGRLNETAGFLPGDVLIVEDDLIIALDLQETLTGLGVKEVRTANSVAMALALIGDRAPSFVLLDLDLGDGSSLEVATRLDELGVPFAFFTGYGLDAAFLGRFAGRPALDKPYSREELEILLKGWSAKRA
jgi:CheY-like chemotaxis protein